MRAFTALFEELERTAGTPAAGDALAAYFRAVAPADAAWALWFLLGRQRTRPISLAHLRQWAAEAAELPAWLIHECHASVGDLAETLALVLPLNPDPDPHPPGLAQLVETHWCPLAHAQPTTQRHLLREAWSRLDTPQRLVWNKLLTGGLHRLVAPSALVHALASLSNLESSVLQHRLLAPWGPTSADFSRLLAPTEPGGEPDRPYPFQLAVDLARPVPDLGSLSDWLVEWNWVGLRAQLIRRARSILLWSTHQEIVSPAFPAIIDAATTLPQGTVLDGVLLGRNGGRRVGWPPVRPSSQPAGPQPVVFMAFDLLEHEGRDLRSLPLERRRERLERVLSQAADAPAPPAKFQQPDLFDSPRTPATVPPRLLLSPALDLADWPEADTLRARARHEGREGLVLKPRASGYGTGHAHEAWWTWKPDPGTCLVVLVAAQPGRGPRTGATAEYTFAVRHGTEFLPVAKTRAGLSEEQIAALDAFVLARTIDRFGPVRLVAPELVFELAFDAVESSTRHKSRIALRAPRIARPRPDLRPADVDPVEILWRLAGIPAATLPPAPRG